MRIEQREALHQTKLLCSLLGYSRQAYYKIIKVQGKSRFEAGLLLAEVNQIRSTQPCLGGRKLLHKLQGFMVSHAISMGRDAFFELLREEGLLVKKRRRKYPKTTFSFHQFHKHPNLIGGFVPIASRQLWVSDITYIKLLDGFAYLSLVTDAYSRKIVGYDLCERLSARGCIAALKMAVKDNSCKQAGLIHHSDRGVQYCCNDYVGLLNRNCIGTSMTQSGDPLENAMAERVNGILKQELLQDRYDSYQQAQPLIGKAIGIYNNERPHSSVDMLTPAQAHQLTGPLKKHWTNYNPFSKERKAVMDR
jgi:putative transposase